NVRNIVLDCGADDAALVASLKVLFKRRANPVCEVLLLRREVPSLLVLVEKRLAFFRAVIFFDRGTGFESFQSFRQEFLIAASLDKTGDCTKSEFTVLRAQFVWDRTVGRFCRVVQVLYALDHALGNWRVELNPGGPVRPGHAFMVAGRELIQVHAD